MKKFRVGQHLDRDSLENLITYIARHFNYLNTMFSVERTRNHFDIYWNMTQAQYDTLCKAYLHDLDAGNVD